jgi:hypothetical protein
VRFFDRLWILDSVDSIATAAWRETPTAQQLRNRYLSALSKLQPWTSIQWKPNGPAITFDNPEAIADFIRRGAWDQDQPMQIRFFPPSQHTALYDLISNGLDAISMVSHDLQELIGLTIGEILLAQEGDFGGGSLSSAVGLIWLNPKAEWSLQRTGENIVHEWIHNMLFLADMVSPLFAVDYTALSKEEAHVTSAILRRKRPFDRCYHSAAVAAGLVFFRTISGDIKGANALIGSAARTVKEIQNKPELMTRSGADLIQEVGQFLETRDCDRIVALLSGMASVVRTETSGKLQ